MQNITQAHLKELFDCRDGNLFWRIKLSSRVDLSKPAGFVRHDGYRLVAIYGEKISCAQVGVYVSPWLFTR